MPFVVVNDDRAAADPVGRVLGRRVAVVEARRGRAAALASDEDGPRLPVPAERPGLVRRGDRHDGVRPARERRDDRRGGPDHVENDGGHAGERDPAHLLERERDVDHGEPAGRSWSRTARMRSRSAFRRMKPSASFCRYTESASNVTTSWR